MALNVTGLNKFHSFKLADHITTVISNFIYDCENFALCEQSVCNLYFLQKDFISEKDKNLGFLSLVLFISQSFLP